MMKNITFDQLPEVVSQMAERLERVEGLLLQNHSEGPAEPDRLMTIEETAGFLHLSTATLYGLTSRAEIPFCKKGKRLYFSKQELTEWVKSGRKKTATEIKAEAAQYLTTKKGKRNG